MKSIIVAILLMSAIPAIAQDGQAKTIKKTFSRETSVSIAIQSDPSIVWALLTNASNYPKWNSTIVSIEGEIAPGEKIRLKSTLDEKRTFKLKIKTFQPEEKLVWGDSKGERVYQITPTADGIIFTMTEKISGVMFPMYAKYIPPFDDSFEQFALDLKRKAEALSEK